MQTIIQVQGTQLQLRWTFHLIDNSLNSPIVCYPVPFIWGSDQTKTRAAPKCTQWWKRKKTKVCVCTFVSLRGHQLRAKSGFLLARFFFVFSLVLLWRFHVVHGWVPMSDRSDGRMKSKNGSRVWKKKISLDSTEVRSQSPRPDAWYMHVVLTEKVPDATLQQTKGEFGLAMN